MHDENFGDKYFNTIKKYQTGQFFTVGSDADNGKIAKFNGFGTKSYLHIYKELPYNIFGFWVLGLEYRGFPCGGSKYKNVRKWPPIVVKLPPGNNFWRQNDPSEAHTQC